MSGPKTGTSARIGKSTAVRAETYQRLARCHRMKYILQTWAMVATVWFIIIAGFAAAAFAVPVVFWTLNYLNVHVYSVWWAWWMPF